MARPLSPEKRHALLTAATYVVAEEGIEAATARIARAAGVAEGTVFTYFPTKDALLNELYLAIKQEVADAILEGMPASRDIPAMIEHVWTGYLRWGGEHDAARRAMMQLAVSDRITDATRKAASQIIGEVESILGQEVQGRFDGEVRFANAIMASLADTTTQFAAMMPEHAGAIERMGLEAVLRIFSNPDESAP